MQMMQMRSLPQRAPSDARGTAAEPATKVIVTAIKSTIYIDNPDTCWVPASSRTPAAVESTVFSKILFCVAAKAVQDTARPAPLRQTEPSSPWPVPECVPSLCRGRSNVLTVSLLWASLIAWLILRAFRQRHALKPLAPSSPPQDAPRVAIIVPARDEAGNIGACVSSLMAQDHPSLAIVVVDDESTDDTAAIVRRLAHKDRRVVLIPGGRLPPGWSGKVNACCAGARAVADAVDWLCFLDADMRAHPKLIASAVAAAEAGALDLLTLAPRQELQSFAERLILPCGLYLLSFSQNLTKLQAPDSDDAVATGQFMLIRRTAYEDVGGHAAVSRSIVED